MDVELKGIVKNSRRVKSGFIFKLFTKDGVIKAFSTQAIYDGESIKAKGYKSGDNVNITQIDKIKGEEVAKDIENSIQLEDIIPFIENEAVKLMWEDIKKMAFRLKFMEKLGRDIIVRFNNDADGISSALILEGVLRTQYIQHNAPIYYKRDAFNDLNVLMNKFNPVLIMLDFGSNEESLEALEILHSAGVEIVIIDHHPPSKEVEKYATLLNPHKYGGGSNITTGYLCFEIARFFGKKDEKLLRISLSGDKSDLVNLKDEDKNNALVIDYVATYVNYGGRLDFYREVMEKESVKNTLLLQAEEKLEEIKREIRKNMKDEKIGEFLLYTINLDSIAKRAEFPGRSKITSQLYEMVKDKNSIVLGFTNKSIIFRISEEAYQKGIDASKIIERIKEDYAEHIESGGGHSKAAALRVKKEESFNIIKESVKKIIESGINER